MTDQNRMSSALLASLMLHALLLALLQIRGLAPQRPSPAESLLDLDVVSLPPPPKAKLASPQQRAKPDAPTASLPESRIVPMPDAGEEKPSESARYESDRDNVVERQSVQRGDRWEDAKQPAAKGETEAEAKPPGRAEAESDAKQARADRAAPPPESASKPGKQTEAKRAAVPAKQPEQVAALPKLDQLLPHAGDFAMAGGAAAAPAEPTAARTRDGGNGRNLMPGRQVALSSRPGVAAYLPSVQEGNITLLNTKASQFAPFVRRVATRVFQHLEIRLRQEASGKIAGSGREYAEVEAVMNRDGELVTAILKNRKSDTQLAAYRILLGSTNEKVFFDRNPPPAAVAADGKIHFILTVDLMVESGSDPNSGRRGTGYSGIAGVGLL